MNRPGLHRQVDVMVGLYGTKVLADADQFNGGGHFRFSFSVFSFKIQPRTHKN
jgi:hypothetical protein